MTLASRGPLKLLPSAESLREKQVDVAKTVNNTTLSAERATFVSGENRKDITQFDFTMASRGLLTRSPEKIGASKLGTSRNWDEHTSRSAKRMYSENDKAECNGSLASIQSLFLSDLCTFRTDYFRPCVLTFAVETKHDFTAEKFTISETKLPATAADAAGTERFVVEQISVSAVDNGSQLISQVERYGRSSTDYTWNPPQNICYNTVARYCRHKELPVRGKSLRRSGIGLNS